jgi:hypothetical protein
LVGVTYIPKSNTTQEENFAVWKKEVWDEYAALGEEFGLTGYLLTLSI